MYVSLCVCSHAAVAALVAPGAPFLHDNSLDKSLKAIKADALERFNKVC